MTAPLPPSDPGGELDVYGLPDRIGGWVAAGIGPHLVAKLDGVELGRTTAAALVEGHPGRRGFSLTFDRPIEPGVVRSGRLAVCPVAAGVSAAPLPPTSTLLGVDVLLASFADITTWRARLGADYADIARKLFDWHPGRVDRAILQPPRPAGWADAGPPEPSPLLFAAGLVSQPGDAVLGRGGVVFLTGGTNAAMEQYTLPAIGEPQRTVARRWQALIDRRRQDAAARGMAYLQTIVPEKISVLPDLFPGAVRTPTATLHVLEAALATDGGADYLSGLAVLRDHPARQALFRCVDTHLSPEGAFRLAFALRQRLAPSALPAPVFDVPRTMAADLGNRFFDKPLLDRVFETTDPAVLGRTPPVMVEQMVPDINAHRGWRQVWRCADAPVRKTVVVFGNSFFNFADYGQTYLSFWFARWFTELHFVWSPAIDWAYAEAHGADAVVGQTIERFLGEVPAT